MAYFSGHNHTHYSNLRMLDCIIKENQLIDYAINLGLSGVAITDHESLSGHVKASQYLNSLKSKAKKVLEENPSDEWANKVINFTLGLGNEIYLCKDNLNAKTYIKGEDRYWHFILIAKDLEGHKQLRLLSSRAWERSYYQFIERVPTYYSDLEDIVGKNPGHLIATSACLGGQLPNFILNNKLKEAANFCKWCLNIFGKDNFFIEIQPGRSKEQITYNTLVIPFAEKLDIPVVVATDSHYLKQEDRPIHKAFLNSRDGDRETDDFYEATYIMSENELRARMDYLSDENFQKIINNTQKEKKAITDYSLFHKQIVPRIPLNFSVFNNTSYSYGAREYINKFFNSPYKEDRYFIQTVFKNGTKLEVLDDVHLDRIEEECKTIWEVSEKISERLSAYFTTVAKIIDIGWEQAGTIIGPWRGSVGSSLCAYLVEITQRDPLKSPIELPFWRFLSLGRAELPDIDVDSQASRREFYIEKIREYYESIGGELVNVATFGTETSKAALVTAARGLGYEPEVGTYLSSLIPIDRGHVRELQYCYDGNEEKGWKPIPQFVKEMNSYEDIWQVAKKIEGLISRRGLHASGIIVTNGPVTNYCATMKGPNGAICTQLELHDSEFCGLLKFDCLTVDALDVIHKCIDLLIEYGYMDWQGSLKSTYMKYLNPDIINYSDKEMWQQAWDGNISKLFQYETPVGGQTIKMIKPESLLQLSQSNSLMRLVPESGQKTPAEEFSEYKKNPDLIWKEISRLNATAEEKKILYDFMKPVGGVLDTQELAMMAVMLPFTNYNVDESNKIRKVIAKKKLKEIDSERAKYFKRGKELGTSEDILHYIWDIQLKRQMGYSFSSIHCIAYSIVAVQELNLAYFYPRIYWNTACLIVDSGGMEDDVESELNEDVALGEDEELVDEIDADDDKKKSSKVVKYGKISTAIGKMKQMGINVQLPDINQSSFTFVPNEEIDTIIYGLKGITKINTEYANEIIKNRPYSSFEDFLTKIKSTKLQIINLIKCGAFDNISSITREELLKNYILSIAGVKKKLTLQNMPTLITRKLIPEEYSDVESVFNFNKFLKKNCKKGNYYFLDEYSLEFYNKHFDADNLYFMGEQYLIEQSKWDKLYKKFMEKIRPWLNDPETLQKLNNDIIYEIWNKYCSGYIPKWEMDSVGFYSGAHELDGVSFGEREIENFFNLPENPIPVSCFRTKDGKEIPLYNLSSIAGTVIEKNKLKNIVTILTQYGVVKVKIYKPQFVKYDKQSFIKDPVTGKKTVTEKSWFTRGNKIIFQGLRREDSFIPKAYKNSPYKPITLISEINYQDGSLSYKTERDD